MTTKPQHIAVIIDSIKLGGGAEKNAALLASLIAKEGRKVTLVTFNTYEQEYSYTCHRVSFAEKSKRFFILKISKSFLRLLKIKRFCKDNEVTHIVSFLNEANTYTLLARLLLRNKPKVLVSVRADPNFISNLSKQIIKILYPYADSVIAVSKEMEKILRTDFKLQNVCTIHNPVDVSKIKERLKRPLPKEYSFLENTNQHPIFVNVGRLTDQKGHIFLIKSFAKFTKLYPMTLLIIIGDGVKKNNLLQEIKSNHLEKNVFLIGYQDNIYPFLRISDCFLLSSFYEGFPNALLEAAASGLYIISTDCNTGPREIIDPGIFGEKISYPYRINGASLVPDLNQFDEKPFDLFYKEMVWFAENKLFEKQSITIDRFSKQIFLNKWLDLIT
ncbi:hypothetical protein A2592_00225 [Candidatus Kaiserbacteria bacterium RIFOXYD1_FULL_42_15]|uniref:Glycosyl transferase family 1 domain-containing protein n=1 Tax=Candidatus Kaiserbacteria bacterium RIFOXYD1_FULL_42_15 TaxID=1798532 RepID=A0A1F6FTT1_9BACT|nr:MAG: hypothetical protein A2592_00225 [Candidatus Kaiserbacteria bacterium RIFOXYD1_FULL_42_15]